MLIVEEIVSRDWASATFEGETHRFELRLEGNPVAVPAAMVRIADGIGEADIHLAGQFVADCAVEAGVAVADGPGRVVQPFVLTALTIIE